MSVSQDTEVRTAFYRHRAVRVLGESPDGRQACIEYADPEDGGHDHVPAAEVTHERYPDVEVDLSGTNDVPGSPLGCTYLIAARVNKVLRHAGFTQVTPAFTAEVTACGTYEDALECARRWVRVL